MMTTKESQLAEAARALEESSARARRWIARVAPTSTRLAAQERALVDSTRRAQNQARKIAASAGRRNSACVFGPSQAGKSYLVSVLGRPKNGRLILDFAGEKIDFLTQINPQGGKESTGLVTRFTVEPGSRDRDHPVELRLLTETDLVKILGNSFLSDFDPSNRKLDLQPTDDIRAALQRLEADANVEATHLDEITVYDICEYFETNFHTAVERLRQAGYWESMIRLAPRLAPAARIDLYSMLWGRAPALTRLFKVLTEGLGSLGHAPLARTVLAAVVPRETGIVNVDVLNGLDSDAGDSDLLSVVPVREDGSEAPALKVARSTLAALVVEVRASMTEEPWAFFRRTDLLDFPGARAREKRLDLPAEPKEAATCVRELFLRGKIAYLFQRYTEERELTSMLLCMAPGNQEVKDLTALVRGWVAQTHGDDAASRRKLQCGLFFVLTKFDEELKDKPGDTPESWANRIDTRLKASMYQLFGHEEWLQNWDGGPFANTYFLRNPAYRLDGIFEYDLAQTESSGLSEIGIASQAQPRLAAIRAGLLANSDCKRHFRNAEEAWNAAVALNEGGAGYMVAQLERVLSPDLKFRQLAGRLAEHAQRLDRDLRQHHAAGAEASRKDKEDALLKLRRKLYAAAKEEQFPFRRFAWLLSCLKTDAGEMRGAYLDVAAMRVEAALPTAGRDKPEEASDPWAEDPWAEQADPALTAETPVPVPKDRYDQFGTLAVGLWAERARALAADERALAALRLDSMTVLDLADELVIGAHRHRLASRIAETTRRQLDSATTRHDRVADRAAGIAAFVINDFVSSLGYGGLPPQDRPSQPEPPKPRQRGVFQPFAIPGRDQPLELGTTSAPLELDHFMDWGVALRQFGLDNLQSSGGREISDEDNRQLGLLLDAMQAALKLDSA